jgi:hypothetical protein
MIARTPPVRFCPVCREQIRHRWVWWDRAANEPVSLCSQRCTGIWTMAYPSQKQFLDKVALEAIEKSLPAVGAAVAEIGMEKPLEAYTRDEILRVICTAYAEVQFQREKILMDDEIPF